MNFLITAIGSMASHVTINVLRALYSESTVVATDIYPANWIWQSSMVDIFHRVPKAADNNYVSEFYNICVRNNIDYVFPLIDPEVDVLSDHHQKFNNSGIVLCMPGKEVVDICIDKLNCYEKFRYKKNMAVIPTYTDLNTARIENGFPLIGKPRKGRSSEGIIKIVNKKELTSFMAGLDNYIFQPFFNGEIYTVDVVRDRSGNSVCVVRKELIRNKIGAGVTVHVMNHPELESISSEIATELDVTGAINIEYVFFNNTYYVMDINPRLSAGVNYTILSGYNIVKNSLRVFNNQEIEPKPILKEGIYYKIYKTYE